MEEKKRPDIITIPAHVSVEDDGHRRRGGEGFAKANHTQEGENEAFHLI
jgi:hypothetical protein